MQSDNPSAERPSSGFLRPFSVFALARGACAALVVAALGAPAGAQDEWPEQDPVTEFVDGCKKALTGGADASSHAALLAGSGSLYGNPAKVQLLVQPGPRYLLEVDGALDLTWACSPKTSWELDATGAQWPLEGADFERRLWLFLVMSGDWLFDPEFAPAITVELEADDGEGELQHARLKLDRGTLDVRLSVFRTSKLPAELVIDNGDSDYKIEFSKWSEGPGHLWPMRTVMDGAATGVVLELERFEPPPSYLVDPFQRKVPIEDTTFDAAVPADVECKRTAKGHWLVHPRVDGKDVGWFLFDPSSAIGALDVRVRKQLDLATVGQRIAQGRTTTVHDFVRASTLTLGPATIRAPLFGAADLSGATADLGVELAGIVGIDFLRRAVVDLDVANTRLLVYPPEGHAFEGVEWTAVHFDRRTPWISAELEAGEVRLKLVLGAVNVLHLYSPFVREHELLKDRKVTPVGPDASGGTLAWLQLEHARLLEVPTIFSTAARGLAARRTLSGEMPCELFGAASRVVFDVPARRVAFVRRAK